MSAVTRVMAVAAITTAALGLSACGGTVIDDAKAQDAIQRTLEANNQIQVKSVDCPSDVEVKAGTTFECEVVSDDGVKATATLKIRNKDADVDFIGLKPHK